MKIYRGMDGIAPCITGFGFRWKARYPNMKGRAILNMAAKRRNLHILRT
jgi:hypothetical protein